MIQRDGHIYIHRIKNTIIVFKVYSMMIHLIYFVILDPLAKSSKKKKRIIMYYNLQSFLTGTPFFHFIRFYVIYHDAICTFMLKVYSKYIDI